LLQRYRPRRPIDGIILAIPCTDLFGSAQSAQARARQAARKGALLYEKLWHAQRFLGMRVPIYVLITKCDAIPGFQSFCQALPPALHEEMFGWSTPYGLETAYTTSWVDEAWQSLAQAMSAAQLEIHAASNNGYDSDGLFLFGTAFHELREPLRGYLNHLFSPSAYHEAFFFRGLYFCGARGAAGTRHVAFPDSLPARLDSPAGAPAVALATPSAAPQPVFVKQVFAGKILPESGLARPVSKTFQVRNRTVILAQCLLVVLALVWGLGLWRATYSLEEGKNTLSRALIEIRDDLSEAEQNQTLPQDKSPTYFDAHVRDVLKGFTDLKFNKLHSIFMPSSWFDSIHQDLRNALVLTYNKLILRALYRGLEKKAQTILQTPAADPGIASERSLWETSQFRALQTFLNDIATFETHVGLYNDLRTQETGTLQQLQQLVHYIFDITLPPIFLSDAHYYKEALYYATYDPFELTLLQGKARNALLQYNSRFSAVAFTDNVLLRQLRGLGRQSDVLRLDVHAMPHGRQALQALSATIGQTQTLLQQPEVAWVAGSTFDLGQAFASLGEKMRKSALLGPEVEQQFQNAAKVAWQRLQGELAGQKTVLTGPLLQQQNGQLQLALSSNVVALQKFLDAFVQQKFVVDDVTLREPLARPTPQPRIAWNPAILAEAVDLARQHDTFVKMALTGLPTALEQALTQLSLRHLDASMNARLIQAQDMAPLLMGIAGFRAEDAVQLEMKSLKAALQTLGTLVTTFEQLGLKTSAQGLISIINFQGVTLLAAVDQILQEERLYDGKDQTFVWWTGSSAPFLAAYEVRSLEALTQYLELQRERVKALGQSYAAPLTAWLTPRAAQLDRTTTRLLTKWNGILTQLDGYDTKKPGNSVAILERFIAQDTADLSTENCLPTLTPQDLNSAPKDFFLERRNTLRGALLSRCQTLVVNTAFTTYAALSNLFNTRLAGQFPFAERVDGAAEVEAEPEVIRTFYRLFDQRGPMDQTTLRSNFITDTAAAQALAFLQDMTAVRAFFAPWLDGKGPPNRPSVDFAVDFRVNRASEQAGNQIIDWILEVGEQTFRATDSQRQGRWRFGDRIRLTLRWAKDAPLQPSLAGTPPGVTVTNQTVGYEYADRWALLTFIRSHASVDAWQDDPAPHTLRFIVGLTPRGVTNGAADAQTAQAQARVFLRLSLTAGEQKDVLVVPRFPTLAPVLAQQAQR
jgi:type VI secretion system protein ImpL